MIKKSFLYAGAALIFFTGTIGYAAEFNAATASSPAQIVIQHALAKTASGTKHVAIRLIAKDGSNLHENQIYQAQFAPASSSSPQDGSYNEQDEEIYIPRLLQSGSAANQTTLRLVNRKTHEFEVVESTFLATESEPNTFFDPKAIHNVNYDFPDK